MSPPRLKELPRIPVLDGFRAYAILIVVVLHLLFLSGALIGQNHTAFGVTVWGIAGNVLDLFFILSGFLLFLPVVLRGGLGDVRRFAVGRAVRLLPAYWLALAASLVVALLLDGYATPPPSDVLIHAATLQMPARLFDSEMQMGFGPNGALWMISIIVGFYVLLALTARAYLRHPLLGLGIAAGLTVAWKLAVTGAPGAFVSLEGGSTQPWVMELIAIDQLPGWLFSFALGMTGAWGYFRLQPVLGRDETRRWALALTGVGGVACALCAYAYGRDAAAINAPFSGSHARSDVLLGLAYTSSRALLMAGIVAGPLWLQRPFTLAPVSRLSDLSYGLYLIHLPVAFALGAGLLGLATDGSPLAVALWLAIVLSVSLVYAQLSRRHLERPLIEWARRRGGEPSGWPLRKRSRT